MLFQLRKQSLFFWPIGIEIETETRINRGGSKVIREIIDLNLVNYYHFCKCSQWLRCPPPPPPHNSPSSLCPYLMNVRSLQQQNLQVLWFLAQIKSHSFFLRLVAAPKMTSLSWSRQIIVKWFCFNASVLGTLEGFPFYFTFWSAQPVSLPFVCFCHGQSHVSFKDLFWVGRLLAGCWQK